MLPIRLTDKLIVGTVESLRCVDGYPPTTEDVAGILGVDDTKRVERALYRALEREKLKLKGCRWYVNPGSLAGSN